jgi:hypothetical protein
MIGFRAHSRSPAPLGVFGKLFLTLFFFVFLAAGSFFVWILARDAILGIRIWTWQPTRCEIITSQVGQSDEGGSNAGNFSLEVRYRYTFGGQTFTSDQYKRNPKSFADYGKVARLAEQYRAGTSAVCYVNPAAPAEAVLDRDNLLTMLLVFFPMIFVVIGAGGIYATWRRKPAGQERESPQPISDRAGWANSRRAGFLFFLVFLLAGGGFFYGFFLRPLFKILNARQWPAVPCVVVSSELKSHSSDDGTTYSINILYRYQFQGREFKANTYHFMGGSSSGYRGKAEIVARHPPGTETVCYVNPNDPTDAVLERGFTPEMWLGLIPLVFVLVGAGGLNRTLRKARPGALTERSPGGGISFGGSPAAGVESLPCGEAPATIVLKPKMAPWAKLLAVLGAALFWNGIVSVFVTQAVRSWRSGHPEYFLTVFMVPFVLIGLGLVGAIVYTFLALFNPRPRLMVTPGAVRLGDTLRVEWEIRGRTELLQNLRLRLEGCEEARYRRGTTTCTDRSVFARVEVANVTASPEMRSGSRTATIPANLMYSFASANNKIVWSIQLHGQINRWPDLKEDFPLTVLPAAPAAPLAS